jgi:hypothetical protein
MSKTFIIEIRQSSANSMTAGIVVQESRGFRFFAAGKAFASLDGCLFRSPSEAEKAATRISGASTERPRPRDRSVVPAVAPVLANPQHPHSQHFAGDDHVER